MNTEKWFKAITLEAAHVKLVPITMEHKDALLEATKDGQLSELWITIIPTEETIESYITKALEDFENDKGLAFSVVDKATDRIIGTTRYTNATPEHRRLEIGYTWYAKSYHRTYVNSECKLLLLSHAFEKLQTIAVEFRTNWFNFESRRAIERLGAKQDGVLRNHQIMEDGSFRDTVVFSIVASEWSLAKRSLVHKINRGNTR